ncbi:hypothetical protein LU689_24005 [Pseudomonas asiatica]|uniref:hypothetical protein n=1 Tax=Pseudomonas asiatica TaxID=2219225 RepID=UPI001E4383B1|nr:hypothetical protein [Pseudomonas asiatica]MCE0852979.1 hypothetical protein [Pseudomonas asiatica]
MSNYQTVNLPRELAESIAKLCMFTMLPQDSQQLRAILAKPTGEPAAWFDPVHNDFLTAAGRATTISMGDGDRLARYTVPLYAAPTAAEELDSVRHWRGKHDVAVRELAEARREGGNSEIAYKAAIEKQDEIKGERDTWKRRAIEAESKLRTYDPQILELCQREVQSLLAEPRPSEVVLMKCVLCDQLQADLTVRDEQIDTLIDGLTRITKAARLGTEPFAIACEVLGELDADGIPDEAQS